MPPPPPLSAVRSNPPRRPSRPRRRRSPGRPPGGRPGRPGRRPARRHRHPGAAPLPGDVATPGSAPIPGGVPGFQDGGASNTALRPVDKVYPALPPPGRLVHGEPVNRALPALGR
ncbi:hypothetical protein KCH_70220 [Kitasatospora cheerisanensis KCTC 2395]|uniref:Uncharacterized protein n=1 Tax=Kitasatospora cheerisanensis KCTC 2395 TaxID=1348663 RepID=A0A066YT21_9ACTN|nr:hypothetical protein KCH_70220 [Kitasatospora cheerisanensis KCTC 2395]